MLFTDVVSTIDVVNSRRLGLALFALAVIIFFGQQYVLAFAYTIVSLSGFYEIILPSYSAIYALSIILIILGVVTFHKGRKEANVTSSVSAEK